MAVMNRFAPVTKSRKQTQSSVICKCCFLSEGILFEQVSLLNTSFLLLPLASRAASRSAVPVSPSPVLPGLVFSSFLLSWSLKLPLSFVFSVCCATISPFAHSCHASVARMQHLLSQTRNDCSVSGTEKHCQLLSMITFPLLGDQQMSPQTGNRRTNHLMHLTALAGLLSPIFHHDIKRVKKKF